MKYTVEIEIINQGEVHMYQIYDDSVHGITRQMFDITEGAKEAVIRQALINLGWTPPKENNENI